MSRILAAGLAIAALALPVPTTAQSLGGTSGGVSSPAVGAAGTSGMVASPGATDGIGTPGTLGGTDPGLPAAPGSTPGSPLDPLDASPDLGLSDIGGPSDELRATQGSTTINSINAGAIARSGDVGAAGAVGVAGIDPGAATIAPPPPMDIPAPRIGVDLGAIRNALAAGSVGTPKPDGD